MSHAKLQTPFNVAIELHVLQCDLQAVFAMQYIYETSCHKMSSSITRLNRNKMRGPTTTEWGVRRF